MVFSGGDEHPVEIRAPESSASDFRYGKLYLGDDRSNGVQMRRCCLAIVAAVVLLRLQGRLVEDHSAAIPLVI